MNRELIGKAIALLVSYREYTGDCRIANKCGEIVEELKVELAKLVEPPIYVERATTDYEDGWEEGFKAGMLAKPEQEPVACGYDETVGMCTSNPCCEQTPLPLAWATFDGEGSYDFRSYEGNETYRDEYLNCEDEKYAKTYANWVIPLYASPTVFADNSAKAVMSTKQENVDTSGQCVHKSDKSVHEPVAWIYDWYGYKSQSETKVLVKDWIATVYSEVSDPTIGAHNIRPLYTAPPRKEWVCKKCGEKNVD